mmetsp:Transcript_26919/g.68422  ORF Transcript_26919/g.68422 Transcript_26919/m.68422 type:complete len:206 (+) Transcript_26919:224-841(+)
MAAGRGVVLALDCAECLLIRFQHGSLLQSHHRLCRFAGHGLLTAQHLVDQHRLSPTDVCQVHGAADDAAACCGACHSGAQDARVVGLAQLLEAARYVHRSAHAAKLHPGLAAKVSRQDLTCVQPDADGQLGQLEGRELLVQRHQGVLLGQRRRARLPGMILDDVGRVPVGKDAVTQDLTNHSTKVLNEPGHHRQVPVQEDEELLG